MKVFFKSRRKRTPPGTLDPPQCFRTYYLPPDPPECEESYVSGSLHTKRSERVNKILLGQKNLKRFVENVGRGKKGTYQDHHVPATFIDSFQSCFDVLSKQLQTRARVCVCVS